MAWALNAVTTADGYTQGNTLANLPVVRRVNLDVLNASIYWQLMLTDSLIEGRGRWDQEVFLTPSFRSIVRSGIVGIRVRSAVAGKPAVVTIEAV